MTLKYINHKWLSYLLLLLGIALFSGITSAAPNPQNRPFDLYSALSRVPVGEWETIAYTNYVGVMQTVNLAWPPDSATLTDEQQHAWAGVWQPDFFNLPLEEFGFSTQQIKYVIEARQANDFTLWIEGDFDTLSIAENLQTAFYRRLAEFPVEAYLTDANDQRRRLMPYIAIPNGNTLLIASTQDNLLKLLAIHDGLSNPLIWDDAGLVRLNELNPDLLSAVLRFDTASQGCAIESSRFIAHGLRYNLDNWQYILNIGFPSEALVTNVTTLTNNLENSTYQVNGYKGILGQHTTILNQDVFTGSGSILQFTMALNPTMQQLPFAVATEPNTCLAFSAPPMSAADQTIAFLPDLSGGRVNYTIQFGNVERALFDAGRQTSSITLDDTLTPQQQAALNNTWRTVLVFEDNFEMLFGFSPTAIQQTADLEMNNGEYVRVMWGTFTTAEVEDALIQTGYVAAEQHDGTRIFTLRDTPNSLLDSVAQNVASPADGVLLLTNSITNSRLTIDIYNNTFTTQLLRSRDLILTARALQDATNATLRRFITPLDVGLVCGLPPYRTEAFANVLRNDGWHFIYALGFNNVAIEDPEILAQNLATILESSDYPLQGLGSETFGERVNVLGTRVTVESSITVVVIDMLISGTDQEASYFGQDLAQSSLPPCALGDITQ